VGESSLQSDQVQSQPGRPLWRSKSLLLAVMAMMLGLVFWARDFVNQGTVHGDRSPASSSLTPATSQSTAGVRSSALFRLGFSFTGGFFIGWLFRKSLKLALLAAGGVALVIAVGKQFGLFDFDWAAVESHTSQGLTWLKGELGAVKKFLTGYLPSAVAGFLGMFKGARHR
jgi:uncharacterized membrane protein (Fun14 family)